MTEKITNRPLADGVVGSFIPTKRFKTAKLSVTLELPLSEDTASAYALLPFVLTGCSKKFPTSMLISRELDRLCGAELACECDKLGDSQILRISITSIENRFALNGEDIVDQCADLLLSLIFEPLIDDGGFDSDNFEKERRLMIERIDGEINNKRTYAIRRTEAEMCKNEPSGVARYGSREKHEAMTRSELLCAWETALRTAFVRVGYLAGEENSRIFDRFAEAFSDIERCPSPVNVPVVGEAKQTVSEISDKMPVKQGKLVLGFRTPVCGDDRKTFKLLVMSDLFGGGPYSLLFDNVREKMSLCYYCAARSNRRKGILMVDSGVEFANMDKAYTEILNQLDRLRDGDFEESTLAASKLSLCDSFRSIGDSQSITDRWFADRIHFDNPPTPDELAELVSSVTKEDITEMANSLKLDTVYRLLGDEEAAK